MTRSDTFRSDGTNPIDCETAVRRLWDFLDGRLPALADDEVKAHLATCADCPRHFAFATSIQKGLAASTPPRALADEEARLRERVRSALGRFAANNG
jgi:anti-sigma factor RsiW